MEQNNLEALALAIKLRDTVDSMPAEEMQETLEGLASSGIFSIRQISSICQKSPSHISRLVRRDSKTGGKLNPEHLELMRGLIFQNSIGQVDWQRVDRIISNGTSPYVLSKITGIPRSTIHRKVSIGRIQQEGRL